MFTGRNILAASALIGSALAQVEVLGAICERETAYVNPIVIEVTVPSPTVLDIYGEVQLTVTEAPTSISTLTYGTRTETETYIYSYTTTFGTITTGAAGTIPTSGSFDTPFALAFSSNGAKMAKRDGSDNSKRDTLQGVSMLTGSGFTDDCGTASSFAIANGTLYRDGYIVSTDVGSAYQELIVTSPVLDILEFFAIADAVLSWTNGNFTSVTATFCSTSDGSVFAVFDGGSGPDGCTAGAIYGIPGANCPGFNAIGPSPNATASASSSSASSTSSMTTSSANGTATSTSMTSSMTSTSVTSSANSSSSTAASSSAASSSAVTSAVSSSVSTTAASSTSSSAIISIASSSVITSPSATVLARAFEEDAADVHVMRRRSKAEPNAKIVRGGFAYVDAEAELAIDEDQ